MPVIICFLNNSKSGLQPWRSGSRVTHMLAATQATYCNLLYHSKYRLHIMAMQILIPSDLRLLKPFISYKITYSGDEWQHLSTPCVNLHPNMALIYTLGVPEAITKKWNLLQISLNKAPQQRLNSQCDVTRFVFWVIDVLRILLYLSSPKSNIPWLRSVHNS